MKRKLIFLILIVLFLSQSLRPPADLDMGWHLRYGQYFFQTGHILKDNIISYIWPDYKWISISWGFDLIIYQIFTHFGFFGLSLSSSLIAFFIFYLVTKPWKRLNFWQFFFLEVLFLSQTANLYGAALRDQTVSTLFFTMTLIISQKTFQEGKKYYLFLPIIFLIWANLHAGFSLGLMILAIFWLTHGLLILFKKPQISKKLWLSFGIMSFISAFTPLINPFGINLYLEGFKHTTNNYLSGIIEWSPITITPIEATVASLVALFTLLIAILRKKLQNLPYILAFLFICFLTFSAIRFFMIFGVMATYFLSQNMFEMNWKKYLRKKFILPFLKALLIAIVLFDALFTTRYFSTPSFNLTHFSWYDYCVASECSEQISQVMLKNLPSGNGFNTYNYGGYLSWRIPQLKTFLDGRMTAWEENGQTPPLTEADNALSNPTSFRKLDIQYQFRWVIIPTRSPLNSYFESLTRSNLWIKKYQDSDFSYYVKR